MRKFLFPINYLLRLTMSLLFREPVGEEICIALTMITGHPISHGKKQRKHFMNTIILARLFLNSKIDELPDM